MKYSKLLGRTRHDAPCDAESVNAKYLAQAGFGEKLAAGIYNILPLGKRVMQKIEGIVREEMNSVDGQELLMPALQPIEIWQQTGRDKTMDDILYRTKGSGGNDFIFGASHEEAVTPLVAKYVQSYKDLPLSVYQFQTKFRNEARAKSGILRGREFGMKDMYSFHVSEADLDEYYGRVMEAYRRSFERCGVKVYVIEASGGAFSDNISHEFSVVTPIGEDRIIFCAKCELAQNSEVAEGIVSEEFIEDEKALEEIAVDRGFSVVENAKAHGVDDKKILKSVIYEVEGEGLIGVVIRGDLNVNEMKLESYIGKRIRAASPATLREMKLIQGFISPVNMPEEIGISFIADHSIKSVNNFVTGANKPGVDYMNVNVGRDFVVKDFADLVEVNSSFKCKNCDGELTEMRAIEAGNIFKLGTKYSDAFGLKYTDKDGVAKPVVMGCYGIGTTRLMGTVVEASHDEKGIIWPVSIAPYKVHLISLGNDEDVLNGCDKIYEDLLENGVEVLYDERDERAGVKLTDADLIGLPVRVVVSKRTLESNCVEWKLRVDDDAEMVKIDDLLGLVIALN